MVQRTYGAMTNDVLISIPLFVLMGYVMERGALVDKMFYSIQLAFRRVPAALAVATLVVCTFWGIASGLVGAVVVLMGVIAMNPMLRAGYDVKLASGVITAGGTLGILIPPSVMIIVYAAVAGQSVVKLYAAAMFPGFFLALLYLVYVIGWAMLNPQDRAAAARGADARAGAGLGRAPAGRLFAQPAGRPRQGAVRAGPRAAAIDADGKPLGYRGILSAISPSRWCRSCWPRSRLAASGGTWSSTRRPSRLPRSPACSRWAARPSHEPQAADENGRRRPSTSGSPAIAALTLAGRRALLLAHGRRALHGAEAARPPR